MRAAKVSLRALTEAEQVSLQRVRRASRARLDRVRRATALLSPGQFNAAIARWFALQSYVEMLLLGLGAMITARTLATGTLYFADQPLAPSTTMMTSATPAPAAAGTVTATPPPPVATRTAAAVVQPATPTPALVGHRYIQSKVQPDQHACNDVTLESPPAVRGTCATTGEPQLLVIVYGAYFSALLALLCLPIALALLTVGRSIRDRLFPLAVPPATASDAKAASAAGDQSATVQHPRQQRQIGRRGRTRTAIGRPSGWLGLDANPLSNVRAAVAVFAPLITGIVAAVGIEASG